MLFIKALFNNPSKLKGREQGRRAFILANGPSILKENLDLLNGELVIGMNASTMLDKKYGFNTSYYVLSDTRFINHSEKRQWATTQLPEKTVRIVRSDLKSYDDPDLASRTFYIRPIDRDGFSYDLSAGFYFGCTTTMLAIQLAYHLGCRKIYLLGCDLRYSPESPRFYKEDNPQLEDAFTSVQLANIANAANLLDQNNVRLFNCSSQSFLRPYLLFAEFNEIFEQDTEQVCSQ